MSRAIKGRGIAKMMSLALDLDVHESAISRWRKGGSMSLDNAARLSEILDISLDWLVLGRGDMNGHTVEFLQSGELELLESLRRLKATALAPLTQFLEEVAPDP